MRTARGWFKKGHKGYGGGVRKGFKHSEATKLKMSRTRTGRKHSEAHKKAMSLASKGKINLGEKHPNWKGDKAGCRALHEWLVNHTPKPDRCQGCNTKEIDIKQRGNRPKLELANMTGVYTRNIKDYKWLCIPCHREYDGQTAKIIKTGKRTRFTKEYWDAPVSR